ncbi:hypothetical protein MTO96_002110 [Rhipicephalus appendiculatus]
MQYYNKETPEDVRARGLTGTLIAYFVIMIVIMFIFSFSIFVYARKKKNCEELGLSSRALEDKDNRQATVGESFQVPPTPRSDYVTPEAGRTTENGVLQTFANLDHW